MPLRSLLLLSSLCALNACTLLVWRDASGPAACDDDVDCPAGEVCAEGGCDVVTTDAVGVEGTLIGVDGGVVIGPDGVELTIPAGAVTVPTTFSIRQTTSTLPRDNFDGDGPFYVIEPARSFASVATLQLPAVDTGDEAFLRPERNTDLAWQRLAVVEGGGFELPRTGVVGRGTGSDR